MIAADLRSAIEKRYAGRPDDLAHVLANAEAWERLKAMGEVGGKPWRAYRGKSRTGRSARRRPR